MTAKLASILLLVCWLVACSGSVYTKAAEHDDADPLGIAGSAGEALGVAGSASSVGGNSVEASSTGGGFSGLAGSSSSTGGSTVATSGVAGGSSSTGGSTATGGSSSNVATGGISAAVARVLSLGSAGASSGILINTTIELVNVSQSDLTLADIRLRYWFTAELAAGASLVTDVGSGLTTQRASIGTVIPIRKGADHYIEITFASGALAAGASIQVNFQAHQANWAAFDQSDDYSYPGRIADGTELLTVSVYRSSVLVAGVEP
jgi:cellulose 1,4-beta-cellobiosidase